MVEIEIIAWGFQRQPGAPRLVLEEAGHPAGTYLPLETSIHLVQPVLDMLVI